MARKKKQGKEEVTLNLTSMLDVTFQLIIFFILVSNFSSAELPKLEPPQPEPSKAFKQAESNKVVVNVIPDETMEKRIARAVRVGGQDIPPTSYGVLTSLLQAEFAADPEVQINLRADKALKYDQVQPVMDAISKSGISRINLVAVAGDE